jgi:hypothetical protein
MGEVSIPKMGIRIVFHKRRGEDDETDNSFSQRYSCGN